LGKTFVHVEKPAARCTGVADGESCDARCTFVQLRFSNAIAAARDGFSRCPFVKNYQIQMTSVLHADTD
jgi:hypothetical protein